EVSRLLRHGGLWLADRRAALGGRPPGDGRNLLVLHPGRAGARRAPPRRRQARTDPRAARTAGEAAGLALLALLLLRVRRLHRARTLAAALLHRRLRPRYHDGRP